MATFSCDVGYGLSGGDMMTTCGGDGSDPFGTWIGAVPACERENKVFKFVQAA